MYINHFYKSYDTGIVSRYTMQNGYLLYPIKGGYSMSEELNKDTLHGLFKDFKENPSDYFEPIDWGEPQGNEVW